MPIDIADARTPNWRRKLQMASFKGAPFYVDQQGRSSGRRTVVHQYPKRDLPYAEDMGREALRYQMTGYLVQAPNWFPPKGQWYTADPTYNGDQFRKHFTNDQVVMFSNYDQARDLLEEALMSKSPGRLVDPYNPQLLGMAGYGAAGPLLFMCEKYSITETRDRGGFCSLEMSFVEGGIPGNVYVISNTTFNVAQTANNATGAAGDNLNQDQSDFNSRFFF